MKLLRATFLAALVTLSFVAFPPFVAAIEETQAPANVSAETQQLRKELEALRQRIEQLERPRLAPPRPTGEADEKARLLAETQQILVHYRAGKSAAWKQTHARIRDLRGEVCAALEEMQAGYTRRAKLDEAVAIRDAIRCMADAGRKVQADPGRLSSSGATSEVLFFRVTGANSGSLYGTGIYTSDSSLATAAVHAGILKQGETGIVKVTTIPSYPQYVGSTQNGITSSSWGSYPGFQVQALDDEDLDLAESETAAASIGTTSGLSGICPPPKPIPAAQDPFGPTPKWSKPSKPSVGAWPAGLPPEAREQVEGYLAATAELREATRERVERMAAEAVNRLTPIQDAHTRAARLNEAIAIRDLIDQLTPKPEARATPARIDASPR